MKIKKNKTMSRQYILAKIIGIILLLSTLFLQMACNDGGGGSSGLLAGGGIGGTGISIGQISAFGSVIVNDVEFDTQQAQVIVNGKPVGNGDAVVRNVLALGMVVRVEGKFQGDRSGTADRILFSENLKGPVTAIEDLDTVIKRITMLDQSVIVDDATKFRGTDFDGLTVGNVLQISGWTDGNGVIQATYVALVSEPADNVTLKGLITEVNAVQKTMRINQLHIEYENADLSGFYPNQRPAAGQSVVVSGILVTNDILVAEELRLENDLEVENADDVELEGIVAHFSSPADFHLGTTPILTDMATVFKGIDPDDIFVGFRLMIKGSLTGGRLLADEVSAREKVNLEGTVESVNFGLEKISLRGISPLTIHVNDATKIFGNANGLTDVRQGQHVKILGYVAGENKVEAARVKIEKRASTRVKLQGPLTFINRPAISVFSVDVDTGTIPRNSFGTTEEGPVSRDEFFDQISLGVTVSVNGNLINNLVRWKEIELLQE